MSSVLEAGVLKCTSVLCLCVCQKLVMVASRGGRSEGERALLPALRVALLHQHVGRYVLCRASVTVCSLTEQQGVGGGRLRQPNRNSSIWLLQGPSDDA